MTHVQVAGMLVPVECESVASTGVSERRHEFVAINGAVTQFAAPRRNRVWTASYDALRPHELAALRSLAGGEFGPGPFRLVDSWAQVTNALDERTSLLEPWVGSANLSTVIRATDDDTAPVGRSVINLSSGVNLCPGVGYFAPAPPAGDPVTVSAYAWGSSTITVRPVWGLADGTTSNGTMSAAQSVPGDGTLGRVHTTEMVPVGAVSVGVAVYGATYAARPCVTWSGELLDWAVGESPRNVVMDSPSVDVLTAWGRPGGQMAGVSVTFREVGP